MIETIKSSMLFDNIPALLSHLFSNDLPPWSALENLKFALEEIIKLKPQGMIEHSAGVLIGEGVEIENGATVMPPAVILGGAKIRQGAYIRGSVFIGEGAVVGHATEVKNSILMDRSQAPHFNYVGDSILGLGAHIGAGVILSNLKIDKSDIVIRHPHGLQNSLEDNEATNPPSQSTDAKPSKADYEIKTGRRKLGAILGDFAEVGCGAVLNPGTVMGKHSVIYPLTSFRGILPAYHIAKSPVVIVKRD